MYLMVLRPAVHNTMYVEVVVNDLSKVWLQRKSYNQSCCAETVEPHQETFQSVNYTQQLFLSAASEVYTLSILFYKIVSIPACIIILWSILTSFNLKHKLTKLLGKREYIFRHVVHLRIFDAMTEMSNQKV